jgi:hypothetical protein
MIGSGSGRSRFFTLRAPVAANSPRAFTDPQARAA